MTGKILTAALISLALTFPSAAPAAKKVGNGTDFTNGAKNGIYFVVQNASSSIVTSVVVRQEGTLGCSPQKQTSKATMWGKGDTEDYFKVWGNDDCTYRVSFKTTKGCTGDKVAKMTPRKLEKGIGTVRLTGACGTLAIKFRKGSKMGGDEPTF